jgi:hypothetical protein
VLTSPSIPSSSNKLLGSDEEEDDPPRACLRALRSSFQLLNSLSKSLSRSSCGPQQQGKAGQLECQSTRQAGRQGQAGMVLRYSWQVQRVPQRGLRKVLHRAVRALQRTAQVKGQLLVIPNAGRRFHLHLCMAAHHQGDLPVV